MRRAPVPSWGMTANLTVSVDGVELTSVLHVSGGMREGHDLGAAWEWYDLGVYFEPKAGRFYWSIQGGRSCSEWVTPSTLSHFQDGDRAALLKAAEHYLASAEIEGDRRLSVLTRLRDWKVGA